MNYKEFLDILEELNFDLDTASEGLEMEVKEIKSWQNMDEIPQKALDWLKKEKVDLADLNNSEVYDDTNEIYDDINEELEDENSLVITEDVKE